MDFTVRYHMLMDQESGHVMIFDAHTGSLQYPKCWQDISAYYHYLLGRGRNDEAQGLLAEAMSGSKPMTSMVERARLPAVWRMDMGTYASEPVKF